MVVFLGEFVQFAEFGWNCFLEASKTSLVTQGSWIFNLFKEMEVYNVEKSYVCVDLQF